MKITTFNIRYDNKEDEKNSFSYRKNLIKQKILKISPDILCFQEVLPHVALWLENELKDYTIFSCGRDENLEDESLSIAIKKGMYNIVSINTRWLSNTPEIAGSRYENQSICPRIYTEILIKNIKTNNIFRIINMHLDHESQDARIKSSKQIISHIENITFFKNVYTILLGDFNATEDSEEVQTLTNYHKFIDFTKGLGGTFHNFSKDENIKKIDYIIGSKELVCTHKELWKDCINGVFLSDHYPVCIELDI